VETFITGINDFVNVKKDALENAFQQSRPPGYNSTPILSGSKDQISGSHV
jgi:hypothetical protein